MNPNEAQAALDSLDEAHRAFALSGPKYPLWRHAVFAAVMAGIVLSQGFSLPVQSVIFVLSMATVAWIVTDDRKRYGLFVNGYRKGRTLPLTLIMVAVVLAAMGAQIYARTHGHSLAIRLGIAGAVFIVCLGSSLLWTRIYDRELIEEAK